MLFQIKSKEQNGLGGGEGEEMVASGRSSTGGGKRPRAGVDRGSLGVVASQRPIRLPKTTHSRGS